MPPAQRSQLYEITRQWADEATAAEPTYTLRWPPRRPPGPCGRTWPEDEKRIKNESAWGSIAGRDDPAETLVS